MSFMIKSVVLLRITKRITFSPYNSFFFKYVSNNFPSESKPLYYYIEIYLA